MAIEWQRIVSENVQQIVATAQASSDKEPVCVLFDLDDVRAGQAAPGIIRLIADIGLKYALALNDSQTGRRLVCLPVSRERFFHCLEQDEDVTEQRERITIKGTVVLWAICCDGDTRTCLDIHVASPEHN